MKNNSISLYRILFTILILLLHIGYGMGSYIAVDFFFVLSGFLLAKKVYGSSKDTSILKYVWNRFARLYPIYIITFFIYLMVFEYCSNPTGFLMKGLHDLPSFWKQIPMLTPFGSEQMITINLPSWYVCVLFYVSIVFYIILKKIDKRIILPMLFAISLVILSFYFITEGNLDLYEIYRSIDIGNQHIPIGSDGLFKGIADMGLGIVLFEIFDKTNSKINNNQLVLCHIIEGALAISVIVASVFLNHTRWDYLYLIAILVFIYLAFLPHNSKFFDNKIINYFGKLSYSIYLNHAVFAWVVFSEYSYNWSLQRTILYIVCVLITSITVDLIVRIISRLIRRNKNEEKVL